MAKIKQIIIGAKKSKAYQTYECTEIIDIEEGDDVEQVKISAQERCRKSCMTEIGIDTVSSKF